MNPFQPTPEKRIAFFVGQPPTPISPENHQWGLPLPMNRKGPAKRSPPNETTITHGDYFTAVTDFLTKAHMAAACRCAAAVMDRSVTADEIEGVSIHLIKHGALYHPSLVTLEMGARRVPVVVNVAVSDEGRDTIEGEARHLAHLNRRFKHRYIPHAYHYGTGRTPHLRPLPMFAGEWFDGYHELHPTGGAGTVRHLVWDSERGPWRLNPEQSADYYRQAMFILTYYFDPHTLSSILEWHHAAGDFIVRAERKGIDTRLVTVRRYGPMIRLGPEDEITLEMLLSTLTLFFLRSSVWMRIDRFDGVGDLAWAGDDTVGPLWKGFCGGLEEMARTHRFPPEFINAVKRYLASHSRNDLMELGMQLFERYPRHVPEAILIRRHLEAHVNQAGKIMEEL